MNSSNCNGKEIHREAKELQSEQIQIQDEQDRLLGLNDQKRLEVEQIKRKLDRDSERSILGLRLK